MLFYTVSLDSGTPEQIAALWAEVEKTLGCQDDPLIILIAEEDANYYLNVIKQEYRYVIRRRNSNAGCPGRRR